MCVCVSLFYSILFKYLSFIKRHLFPHHKFLMKVL